MIYFKCHNSSQHDCSETQENPLDQPPLCIDVTHTSKLLLSHAELSLSPTLSNFNQDQWQLGANSSFYAAL